MDDIEERHNTISFHPSSGDYWGAYLLYYPKYETEDWSDRIHIRRSDVRWDSFNNFFTKNFDELGVIIGSIFSIETQKKYTGKFVFQEYEYFESYNNKNDNITKEKIEQKIITVDIDENGYLLFTGIPTYENPFIRDNDKRIGGYVGDGTVTSTFRSCYFLNEDTIIDEYDYWRRIEDDGKNNSLKYKVKYVKIE